MEQMIPVIPFWIMMTIGILLMAAEMLTMSFVLALFGAAFILTGITGFFVDFSSGETQLITAFTAGILLTLLLRKTLQQRIYHSKELEMETLTTGENGEVILTPDGDFRVAYKGTTWAIANPQDYSFEEGIHVTVVELKNNKAHIQIH